MESYSVISSPSFPLIEARVTAPGDYPGSTSSGATAGWYFLGFGDSYSDYFHHDVALSYSAVWACVRVISQSLAATGWHVYMTTGKRQDRVPLEDDVAWVLEMQASPEMTALAFREVMLKDALTFGNGYAEIERDGFGRVRWLYRLEPSRVQLKRDEGKLYYEVGSGSGHETVHLAPENVFHLKGLSSDGLVGYSVIAMARKTIELGMQQEKFGNKYFSRGPMPGGILKIPGNVNPEAKKEARTSFETTYGGAANAGRVVVLTGGMEFSPLSLPNSDSQWLESRKFQVTEIARWYGVPPHKLGDLDRATFSNIEEQERAFVTDCLLPWARRLESEADVKLFGRTNRGKRFTKLNLDALMRGNSATQTSTVTSKVTSGLMTINEGREYFDLNPIDGGDTPLVQGAMVPLERVLEEPEPPPPLPPPPEPDDPTATDAEKNPPPEPEALMRVFAALLTLAYARLLHTCRDKAMRAAKSGQLATHVQNFYVGPDAMAQVAEILSPPFAMLLGDTLGRDASARAAVRHIAWCSAQLRDGVPGQEVWEERAIAATAMDVAEIRAGCENPTQGDDGRFTGCEGSGGGETEDDAIETAREKEDAAREAEHEKEDTARDAAHEKEDDERDAARTKEDGEREAARTKEDKDAAASSEKEDAAIFEARDKEDAAAEAAAEARESAREKSDSEYLAAIDQIVERQDEAEARTEEWHDKETERIEQEQAEGRLNEAQAAKEQARADAARQTEFRAAERQAAKERAELDRTSDKEDARREAEDARVEKEETARQAAREKEDDKREAAREKEDAQTAAAREKEDDKREAAREKEDKARNAARLKEEVKRDADRKREQEARSVERAKADKARRTESAQAGG